MEHLLRIFQDLSQSQPGAMFAVCLRMQVDPANQDFKQLSPERAFADYVLCNALLHLVIWNFMG